MYWILVLKKRTYKFFSTSGSQTGPDLFCLYSSTIETIIPENINLNAFVDDHTINNSFQRDYFGLSELHCLNTLEECCKKIKNWMDENRLKMNDGKTEAIKFRTRSQLHKCPQNYMKINGSKIEFK